MSEVSKFFEHFYALIKHNLENPLKLFVLIIVRNSYVQNHFFLKHSIFHQTPLVSTPQQNGQVELKHRQILNITHALLFQASSFIFGENVCKLLRTL